MGDRFFYDLGTSKIDGFGVKKDPTKPSPDIEKGAIAGGVAFIIPREGTDGGSNPTKTRHNCGF